MPRAGGERKKSKDSCYQHARIYIFMRLTPWESRGLGRVTISLGRSKRNWQDNDSKVMLKHHQKNFIHPIYTVMARTWSLLLSSHC